MAIFGTLGASCAVICVGDLWGRRQHTRSHHTLVERIHQETSLTPAAHLTCIAASKQDIDAIAQRYWNGGIRHIVALRGDMPQEDRSATKNGDYRYASELVTALKKLPTLKYRWRRIQRCIPKP